MAFRAPPSSIDNIILLDEWEAAFFSRHNNDDVILLDQKPDVDYHRFVTPASRRINVTPGMHFDRLHEYRVNVDGDFQLERYRSFADAITNEGLLKKVSSLFDRGLLPIQEYAMPYIKDGRDLMAHSVTGSGKTLAYALPILDSLLGRGSIDHLMRTLHKATVDFERRRHIDDDPLLDAMMNDDGDYPNLRIICQTPDNPYYSSKRVKPRALILVPTRELALQTWQKFDQLAEDIINIRICGAYGGHPYAKCLERLQRGCDILIGTPGRIEHMIRVGDLSLDNCEYLVLDEADKLMKDPFDLDVRKIIDGGHLSVIHQKSLFSATYPYYIRQMCREDFLLAPIEISVGKIGTINQDIDQKFIEIHPPEQRRDVLDKILDQELPSNGDYRLKDDEDCKQKKILIFVRSRLDAGILRDSLREKYGYSIEKLCGKMTQRCRERAFTAFRQGNCTVLVATASAERGWDVKDIDLVINYNLPRDMDEYVQRVGRCGRLGNPGRSITLLENGKISPRFRRGLVQSLKNYRGSPRPIPKILIDLSKRSERKRGSRVFCRSSPPEKRRRHA